MDNSTQFELIRYVDGEMAGSEKAEFEKKLATDDELREALGNMQMAKEAVQQYGLKEQVAGIHRQMMKESGRDRGEAAPGLKKTHNIRRLVRITIAVAASVLLVFVLIEGYKFYSLSPEELYAKTYTPYELGTTRDGEQTESPVERAYREKNYDQVIRLNANSVLSVKDIFLTGMAYLATNDYARAMSSLQVVIADLRDDKSLLKDAAEYYLALTYLQNRDYDQAIELMNAIHTNPSHLYKEKFSRKFINQVKRLKWR